jgi:hypothetical protein
MRRAFTIIAAVVAVLGSAPAFASKVEASEAAARKLHALGYPADMALAVQRWRSDTGRRETGELTTDETSALMAQPMPEFIGAMVGNPFTGMGLAMRHKSRDDAEREATRLCKANGGGSTCVSPMVVRADQCVVIVGYSVTVDRRPTYRTSVAVSTDLKASLDAATEACPQGASHPELCRPLLSYCGDGRDFKVFETSSADGPAPR